MNFQVAPSRRPRSNYTNESGSVATDLANKILKLRESQFHVATLARMVEEVINQQLNERLELLATSILSGIGLEDSLGVRAAISRGSVTQVATNVCYEARKEHAAMAREMKTCHFQVDSLDLDKVQASPSRKWRGDDEDTFAQDEEDEEPRRGTSLRAHLRDDPLRS